MPQPRPPAAAAGRRNGVLCMSVLSPAVRRRCQLPRPDKATQHLPHFDRARARRDARILGGESPQLLFVVGLHDAKTPGAAGVEHGTEDHHLARLDQGPPVLGVARHDLALLVAHVQRERRAGRLEPEYEGAHEPTMPKFPAAAGATAVHPERSRRPDRPATPIWYS